MSQPRYHHQYLPDSIQVEPGAASEDVQADMILKGHKFKNLNYGYGNMQVVINKNKKVSAASDPRGEGLSVIVK